MPVTEEKTEEKKIYAYGKDRTFTREEYDELMGQLDAATERDDEVEMFRLAKIIPMDADVLMAVATGFGRERILSIGFDLTPANMKFGEGWINEVKP